MGITENKIQTLEGLISSAKYIIITAHKSPDGDSVGSSLGFFHYLNKITSNVHICHPDVAPVFLHWMPGYDSIQTLEKNETEVKAFETRMAVANGADEIDMVINIGAVKSGKFNDVKTDIQSVKESAQGRLLKVILETCLLNDEEKIQACKVSVEAGADFVKTSTGFSSGGATVEDVRLMRHTVAAEIGVKASGGIRDYQTACDMVEAGANRLGTSSGLVIVGAENNSAEGGY